MVKKLLETLVDQRKMSERFSRILSMVCLGIAVLITLKSYTDESWLPFGIGDTERSISPDLRSGLFALLLIMPLYLRSIIPWKRNAFSIISLILIWSILASFVRIITEYKIFLVSIDGKTFLSFAILLSWLAIRPVAGLCWIIVALLAVFGSAQASDAMGGLGFIFLILAFSGVLLQTKQTPGSVMRELVREYTPSERLRESAAADAKAFTDKIM